MQNMGVRTIHEVFEVYLKYNIHPIQDLLFVEYQVYAQPETSRTFSKPVSSRNAFWGACLSTTSALTGTLALRQ